MVAACTCGCDLMWFDLWCTWYWCACFTRTTGRVRSAFSMNVPNVNYSDPEQTWWNMVAIICGVIGLAPLVPVSLWMLRYTD